MIIVNKVDMEQTPGMQPLPNLAIYEGLGYKVVRVSTVTGFGIHDLEGVLRSVPKP